MRTSYFSFLTPLALNSRNSVTSGIHCKVALKRSKLALSVFDYLGKLICDV